MDNQSMLENIAEMLVESDVSAKEAEREGQDSAFWNLVLTRENLNSIKKATGLSSRKIMRKMTKGDTGRKWRKPKRGGEKAWKEERRAKKLARS